MRIRVLRSLGWLSGILLVLCAIANSSGLVPPPLERPQLDFSAVGNGAEIRLDPDSGYYSILYIGNSGERVEVMYEPRGKVDVVVRASVKPFPGVMRTLEYSYRLESLETSDQVVDGFTVETEGVEVEGKGPEHWWVDKLAHRPAIKWSAMLAKGTGVQPGASASGFRLVPKDLAKGAAAEDALTLPGIVRCFVRGQALTTVFPDEPPATVEDNLPRPLEDAARGWTLGPVAAPQGSDPTAIVARLGEDLEKAWKAGWIDGVETFEDLREGLRSLLADDEAAEPEASGEFLFLVHKKSAAGLITDEIAQLLKINVAAATGAPR